MHTITFSKQASGDIAKIIKMQQQSYDIIASNPVGESNQIQELKKRAELLPQKIGEYMKKKIIPYKVLGEIRETHMKHSSLQYIYIYIYPVYREGKNKTANTDSCIYGEFFVISLKTFLHFAFSQYNRQYIFTQKPMKIISWNVNGIRAVAKKGLKEFVASENPDILCIQETKAFEEQFLKDVGNLDGYKYVWHTGTRAGYAGTAIFYRESIEVIDTKNDFDDREHFHSDGRVTELEFRYNDEHIVLLNGYFPNGGMRADGTDMVPYKLDFYDHMIHYTSELVKEGKQVIVTGDLNICHTEIDIARPKENQNSVGFLPIERAKVSEFLDAGFADVWREHNPDTLDVYSWWSYRGGARSRNVGWRIDYFVVNTDFLSQVKSMSYMCDTLGSDHCPVMLEI